MTKQLYTATAVAQLIEGALHGKRPLTCLTEWNEDLQQEVVFSVSAWAVPQPIHDALPDDASTQ